MISDDDEPYAEIIPPGRTRAATRVYDSSRALSRDIHAVRPGYGLPNLIATLRNRSAARLTDARTANIEALTRLLYALDTLNYAMMEREWTLRQHGNLDAILDKREKNLAEEQAHQERLTRINREREIREAERARDRASGGTEAKERPPKLSPEERIRQTIVRRKELRDACNAYVEEILEAARVSGTEHTEEVQREINNIKDDFAKEISKTYEKG